MINKSFVTNFTALLLVLVGHYLTLQQHQWADMLLMVGYFSLSGGLTNWIAIHMLFEKIPFLYGSGVIPIHFQEFKQGIKDLILEEFFNEDNIRKFLHEKQQGAGLTPEVLKERIDFEKIFQGIVEAIQESPMGNMLAMVGGPEALQPLKEPIEKKLMAIVDELLLGDDSAAQDEESDPVENMVTKLQKEVVYIVDLRLEELTPQMVKEIVQDMIRRHLGWLVVWGGVFGGIIGGIVTVFNA